MAAIIVIDTLAGAAKTLGKLADVLFTGHKWSADLLLNHMEDTIYSRGPARTSSVRPGVQGDPVAHPGRQGKAPGGVSRLAEPWGAAALGGG